MASELKGPTCRTLEWQVGPFRSEEIRDVLEDGGLFPCELEVTYTAPMKLVDKDVT